MSLRQAISVLLVTTTVGAALAYAWYRRNDPGDVSAYRDAALRITSLHRAKVTPAANDWLTLHDEPGQTFDEYLNSDPPRPSKQLAVLYVLPLGEFNEAQDRLTDDTADLLGQFYGLPVKKLPHRALDAVPESARRLHPRWGGKQILSTYLLDQLEHERPADGAALLALTTSDLYPEPSANFVFGQASLQNRVGVWSLHRFGDPEKEYSKVLLRTAKLAVHETGHMFGLWHCTAYQCGMNGTNHLDETDATPLAFCPECEQKIWWSCLVDPRQRYDALIEFADRCQLAEPAAFWRRSREAMDEPIATK